MSSKRSIRRESARRQLKALERAALLKRYVEVFGAAAPVSQIDRRSKAQRAADWVRAWLPIAVEVGRALFPTLARILGRLR